MRVYQINYDLTNPGQKYDELYKRIKDVKLDGGRPMQSMWMITSNHTAEQIRDHLLGALDSNDKLMVNVATAPAAWYGLSAEWSGWLLTQLSALV